MNKIRALELEAAMLLKRKTAVTNLEARTATL